MIVDDARGVGAVLARGVGEHPGVRVLDGDRRVDDRRGRVGQPEQVAEARLDRVVRLDLVGRRVEHRPQQPARPAPTTAPACTSTTAIPLACAAVRTAARRAAAAA